MTNYRERLLLLIIYQYFFMITLFNHYQNSLTREHYLTKKDNKTQMNSEKDNGKKIHFYIASKEWLSSFYSFNKSLSKELVANNFSLNELVKSYLNMGPTKKTVINRRKDNKTRYSADRVYTGKAELQHTNSELFISVDTYNKKKAMLEKKLRRFVMLIKFWVIIVKKKKKYIPYYKNRLLHTLKGNFFVISKWNLTFFVEKTNLFNYLLKTKWRKFHFYDYIPSIKKSTSAHLQNLYSLLNYSNKRFKKINKLEKFLSQITENIHFNTSLYNNLTLFWEKLGLISLLGKLYSKNIRMSIAESRAVHLNSETFVSAVALKLRDRTNNPVKLLRKSVLNTVRIPDLHTTITFDDNRETLNKNNVINNINQQVVTGVRLEASGRLTRRLTAMRAVFKYRYAGSLKNIRSSFNNESTTMLRGYLKSNLQHSLVNSKTRNGTFGLKGWVSSHILDSSLHLLSYFTFLELNVDLELCTNFSRSLTSIKHLWEEKNQLQYNIREKTAQETFPEYARINKDPITMAFGTLDSLQELKTYDWHINKIIQEEHEKGNSFKWLLDKWKTDWDKFCVEQKNLYVKKHNWGINDLYTQDASWKNDPAVKTFILDPKKSLTELIMEPNPGTFCQYTSESLLPLLIVVEGCEIPIISIISIIFRVYKNTQCFWDYYFTIIKLYYKLQLTTVLAKLKNIIKK